MSTRPTSQKKPAKQTVQPPSKEAVKRREQALRENLQRRKQTSSSTKKS